jgi:hypothetical protein
MMLTNNEFHEMIILTNYEFHEFHELKNDLRQLLLVIRRYLLPI